MSARIIAKLLDYTWFTSLVLSILDSLEVNLWVSLSFIPFVPLLFAPIEALFYRLFGSTLGKILFGLRYEKPLSWKASFASAFRIAFLIQPLFIPVVNILFGLLYLKEWRRYSNVRWNPPGKPHLIRKFPSLFPYGMILSISLLVSLFSFLPDWTLDQVNRIVKIEERGFFKKPGSLFSGDENWVKTSPEDLAFSIFFPNTPVFSDTNRPTPKSRLTLTYL